MTSREQKRCYKAGKIVQSTEKEHNIDESGLGSLPKVLCHLSIYPCFNWQNVVIGEKLRLNPQQFLNVHTFRAINTQQLINSSIS